MWIWLVFWRLSVKNSGRKRLLVALVSWMNVTDYFNSFVLFLLGTFAKLRKATISFVMSVQLSVCLSVRIEQLGSHWTDFHDAWYLNIFQKSFEKIPISLKSDKNNSTLYQDVCTFMIISPSVPLTMRMSRIKVVEKVKTHIACSITSFRKSCLFWDNVEKFGRSGQATDNNIIRLTRIACWITKATDTHSDYIILIAFPWQKMVTRKRLNVTFIRTLSVLFKILPLIYLHCNI
jgi:hypothetical protein